MFQDRTLTCRDCGKEFVFSASEQQFFAEKEFTNDPSRCPECRAARKQNRGDGRGGSRSLRSGKCIRQYVQPVARHHGAVPAQWRPPCLLQRLLLQKQEPVLSILINCRIEDSGNVLIDYGEMRTSSRGRTLREGFFFSSKDFKKDLDLKFYS